jgi:hypothetical protein
MKENDETYLEEILASIEFPGEDNNYIAKFFQERDFSASVMNAINERNNRIKRALFWFVFTLLNILVLYILGTNKFIINDFFSFHKDLSMLFFLFLGVSMVGGLIGLIIQVDMSWFTEISEWVGDVLLKRDQ